MAVRDQAPERAEDASSVEFRESARWIEAAPLRFVPRLAGDDRAGAVGRAVAAVGAGGEERGVASAQLERHQQGKVLIASSGRRAFRHGDLELAARSDG